MYNMATLFIIAKKYKTLKHLSTTELTKYYIYSKEYYPDMQNYKLFINIITLMNLNNISEKVHNQSPHTALIYTWCFSRKSPRNRVDY